MGLRSVLSHRRTALMAACCAVIILIGCGKDDPAVTPTAPEAATNTTDTQFVNSSQASDDIDFNDLTGSRGQSPALVGGDSAAGSVSNPSISTSITVVAERHGIEKEFSNGTTEKRYGIRLMSDKSVVLHGRYVEYYPNGKQFKSGSYTNGLQDGQWVYWYENGKVAKAGRYKLGEHDGKWIYGSKEGLKRRVESYTNGKRDGIWLYYQKDAERLARQVEWKNDVREGRTIEYYPNGQRQTSSEWKNDKLHGRLLKWYADGKKLGYEEYKNGERNGRAIMWSQSGTVQADLVYRDDRRVSGG